MKNSDDGKVLPFRGKRDPITPSELLVNALEEARNYPVKHAFVILTDEAGTPSFWGTDFNDAEYCKMLMDLHLHVLHVLSGAVARE